MDCRGPCIVLRHVHSRLSDAMVGITSLPPQPRKRRAQRANIPISGVLHCPSQMCTPEEASSCLAS